MHGETVKFKVIAVYSSIHKNHKVKLLKFRHIGTYVGQWELRNQQAS